MTSCAVLCSLQKWLKRMLLVACASAVFAPNLSAAEEPFQLIGKPQQGQLLIGYTEPGTRIEFEDTPLRVSADGQFVLGLGRDEEKVVYFYVTPPGGSTLQYALEVEHREYRIQRIDGLPKRVVTPSESDLARIRAEAVRAERARAQDHERAEFLQGWQWPIVGRITGVYGTQRILNGTPSRPHFGVDVAAPTGAEVVAPAAGTVTLAHKDMFYSGGTLIIGHGHGVSSSFLHLSKILVAEGDEVEQGQPIALVGSTGRSTGPHLDWRMNWFDRRIDPMLIAPPMPRE